MIDQYIRQYGKRLYGLCLTLCANPHEAEDLYQDTWLKALKNISQYDPARDFEPWLTKICVNTYRNSLRRFLNSPIFNGFSSTEEKDNLLNSIPSEMGKDYSSLYEAIDKLPKKHRITIILFYFQDMDIEMTAQVLGIPPGTVKSRLSKARQFLKEALVNETDLQF